MSHQADWTASHAFTAILCAGLACGVLDLTAAVLTWMQKGVKPVRVLQGIASGLVGPQAAFAGGWQTAALGAACHFFIAFAAATVFYFASQRMVWLLDHPFLAGPLFGVAVYLVMYWLVMPLSRIGPRPFSWPATLLAIATHIVCVGSPIAFVVRAFSSR